MDINQTEIMGIGGFFWFTGTVEDNSNDPLQIGRVKVRINNIHSPDKSKVTLDHLPWASIMQPPTSAAHIKI